MRAGLFGGTFNPIHNGHLMVAREALERFVLDRLYIIPCWTPPHKHPAYLAPAADRVRLIQLALPDDARFFLGEIEIQRKGTSYTIDTVNDFRARITPGADLFLIMGMDAFLDIHTWKNQRQLLAAIQPVVVTRRMDTDEKSADEIACLDGFIRSRLSADYRLDEQGPCWRTPAGLAIHLLATTPVEISSTTVRRRIRDGKAIGDLVPPAVGAYIEQKELYK
jgi:nicotinate-nucleotide adenylyltransferase